MLERTCTGHYSHNSGPLSAWLYSPHHPHASPFLLGLRTFSFWYIKSQPDDSAAVYNIEADLIAKNLRSGLWSDVNSDEDAGHACVDDFPVALSYRAPFEPVSRSNYPPESGQP